MIVLLKADFFAPNNSLYQRDARGTTIPDEFRDYLPENAKVIKDRLAAPQEVMRRTGQQDLTALQHLDADRAAGKALDDKVQIANDEVEAQRQKNADRLRAELAKK